jgi:Spy/CpxP family protein refolding chaperone
VFNFRSMLVPAALVTALAVPATGFAQVQPAQGQLAPAQGQGERHRGGFGFMREMRELNLSAQQQSQIQQLVQQFRQAHPRGSAPDPQARKDLRAKIMAVLTPAQQAQLKADEQKRRDEFGEGRNRGSRPGFPQASPSPSP